MRCHYVLLALASALSACAATRSPARPDVDEPFAPSLTRLDVGIGVRRLEDAWAPHENATALTLDYQEGDRLGPFALEGGVHYARDRARVSAGAAGTEPVDLELLEISAGLRLELGDRRLVPYVGAGGSLVFTSREFFDGSAVVDEDEAEFGGYAKSGVFLYLSPGRRVGFEARWLSAEALGDSRELLVVLGTGW